MQYNSFTKTITALAWLISLVATLGSLYFSEIMGLEPCVLCWYQRIVMYPLVVILPIALARKERAIYWYVLPLSLIGFAVAVYQYILTLTTPASIICVDGVSCIQETIKWLGFINLPLLSTAGFAAITLLMAYLALKNKQQ